MGSSLPALADKSLNYIYIEAGEGNSSGGHSALQLEDNVFHYQYIDSGLIRLEKQSADDFEFNYRYAANRTIHLSHINISEQSYDLLHDYFNLQHQIQQQQFSHLDELEKDRRLINILLGHSNNTRMEDLSIEGGGLFYTEADFFTAQHHLQIKPPESQSPTMAQLHHAIIQSYGDNFLAFRYAEITRRIAQLMPPHWPEKKLTLDSNSLPAVRYFFANQYLDSIAALLALRAIEQHRPLLAEGILSTAYPEFTLTAEELNTLQHYRERLLSGLIKLVNSRRPDWGYAVLVNSARLISIDQSIRAGRLIVVDTFENHSPFVDDINSPEYRAELQAHINDLRHYFLDAKQALANQAELDETHYSRLEMLANRYSELLKTTSGQKPIRLYGANLVPTKSIKLPLLRVPPLSPKTLEQALRQLGEYHSRYMKSLQQLYSYNLFTRNCVTELFHSIDLAFMQYQQTAWDKQSAPASKQRQSLIRLGGFVDTTTINFIPVTSFYSVRHNYHVSQKRTLPSLRLLRLNRLYQNENDFLVYFRENNTLTSTIYKRHDGDSFFIFFTDNELLLRPLFGAANTLAAIGQSLLGLFSWPFDSGTMLDSGTTGILMSLPELAFFNMRKGSFKYLPYSSLLLSTQQMSLTSE